MSVAAEISVPRIPLGDWFESAFDWVTNNLSGVFDALSSFFQAVSDGLSDVLLFLPPVAMALLLAVLALLVRSWKFAVISAVFFALIIGMDQWDNTMATLSMVVVAAAVAVIIAIPLGILAARSPFASTIVRPFMDFMQTMPAFVWLVPAITLFGIGAVPGIVATIIFALPPGVRLTELGIRQVDPETVEAGHAFGSTPRQILRGIQLPLAMPTIMAGVNQVIMLALSMAVIAGLVGAPGLGQVVVSGIQTVDIALAFEGGLAVVFIAIYLDRLTGAFGQRQPGQPSRLAILGRRVRGTRTSPHAAQAAEEEPQVPQPA